MFLATKELVSFVGEAYNSLFALEFLIAYLASNSNWLSFNLNVLAFGMVSAVRSREYNSLFFFELAIDIIAAI